MEDYTLTKCGKVIPFYRAVRLANGMSTTIDATFDTQVSFRGKTIPVSFLILEDLLDDWIIGMDFLERIHSTLTVGDSSITLQVTPEHLYSPTLSDLLEALNYSGESLEGPYQDQGKTIRETSNVVRNGIMSQNNLQPGEEEPKRSEVRVNKANRDIQNNNGRVKTHGPNESRKDICVGNGVFNRSWRERESEVVSVVTGLF